MELRKSDRLAGNTDVLFVKDVARLLRCSTDTVLDLIHTGTLPAYRMRKGDRVGRAWRIDRADVERIKVRETMPEPQWETPL